MSTFKNSGSFDHKVDPEILSKAEDRMGKRRARLLLQQPFYGVLLSMVDFIPESSIPTMAADGAKVYYNPEFVMSITDEEVFGVILHEISHCIYMHCSSKRKLNRSQNRWNYACFPAGTNVCDKKIENIVEGDILFGSDGQKQKVTQTMSKQYSGNLHTISATGILPFTCTEDHPIRVVSRNRSHPIKLSDPVWKDAKDVDVKYDYLVVPTIQGNLNTSVIDLSKYLDLSIINGHDQCHNVADCVKNGINLDEDFAWFMGIYTAEGSKISRKNTGIQFSLHENETIYHDKITKIANRLGYKCAIYSNHCDDNKSVNVIVWSTLLSRFFEDVIGRGAKNKVIPDVILYNKDLNILSAYLQGLFDGDGCMVKPNVNQLATVSVSLALQVQSAIGRLGYFAQVRKNIMKERTIRDDILSASEIYVVDWRKPKTSTRNMNNATINSTSVRWKKVGNDFVVPVTSNDFGHFNGKVYNMSTEDHTYTVSNVLVHNCDYAINLEIKDMGYSLPPNLLLDTQYKDMCAEQIYDKLPDDDEALAKLGLPFDIHINNTDESSWDDMEDKIMTAYEMTKNQKGRGDTPAGLKRWIEKLKRSKVKWQQIFHRYVGQALAKDDYSFTRVNRRFVSQDIYLPDLKNHIVGNVVVAIDTSGSIGRNCLEQFASELARISHLVSEVTAMSCDAQVHEVVKVRKFENFLKDLQMKGGGGTAFEPVFDKVEEMNMVPELLIYLTDAMGSYPKKAPEYPVLWVVTCESGMQYIPWGQKVLMPNEEGDW